jgi:hypothetical protein
MSRAQHRLELARGLLRLSKKDDVLKVLKRMPVFQFWHFQQLVDWLEDFEGT